MNDVTLWINDTNGTAAVKNGSVIHTMPLWAFEGMRDIIVAEAEKKVEVTHRDFDVQQELLDRYRAENTKLRELLRDMWEMAHPEAPSAFEAEFTDRMRELGVGVDGCAE